MDLSIRNYNVNTPAFRATLDPATNDAILSGIERAVGKEKNPEEAQLLRGTLNRKYSDMLSLVYGLDEGKIYLSDDLGTKGKSIKLSFIGPHRCLNYNLSNVVLRDVVFSNNNIGMRNSRKVLSFPAIGLDEIIDCLTKIKNFKI